MTRIKSHYRAFDVNPLHPVLQAIRAADLTDDQADYFWGQAWRSLDLPTGSDQSQAFALLLEELSLVQVHSVEVSRCCS